MLHDLVSDIYYINSTRRNIASLKDGIASSASWRYESACADVEDTITWPFFYLRHLTEHLEESQLSSLMRRRVLYGASSFPRMIYLFHYSVAFQVSTKKTLPVIPPSSRASNSYRFRASAEKVALIPIGLDGYRLCAV